MKRRLIIILVTIVHLVLIAWAIRAWDSGKGGRRDQAAGQPGQAAADRAPAAVAGQSQAATDSKPSLKNTPLTYQPRPLNKAVEARSTACRTGILIDWSSHRILWRKEADRPVPIASMTKMMTALLLAERVRNDPGLSLDTLVKITPAAAKIGGSQVWLDPRESLSLDDLLKCIMIMSANDAAFQIAHFLGGGDPAAFVKAMNRRARELGLERASFHSPHGLPGRSERDSDQATATEMAFLAARLLDYPEVVKWSSTRLSYIRENHPTFNPFQLVNRNRLITNAPGVNGMKTGFTSEAGFCVATTCVRDGRTLIAVVTGCSTSQDRDELVKALLDWGYTQ